MVKSSFIYLHVPFLITSAQPFLPLLQRDLFFFAILRSFFLQLCSSMPHVFRLILLFGTLTREKRRI